MILGWQRALIKTTGALEDEPEIDVITRTMELIYAALSIEAADAAAARGAASDDDSITKLALSALERIDRARSAF